MLRYYSIFKSRAAIIMIALVAVLVLNSCEKYEKKAENSSFSLRAYASQLDAANARLELNITEGSIKGDCTSVFRMYDASGNAYHNFIVYFTDGSLVQTGMSWNFSDDGKMSFLFGSLSPGVYKVIVDVRRWYHTASKECELIIE